MYTIKTISNANTLIDSFNKSKKGVTWKESVQKYQLNLLENTYKTKKALESNTYKSGRFVEFPLSQRGKTRWIKSLHIRDRVVQRAICDYVLLPQLQKYFIYDNGASLKNKGVDFALDRFKKHLQDYYKENHSNQGYIVTIDFTKYFDNINHEILIPMLTRDLEDQDLKKLILYLISLFQIDVKNIPVKLQKQLSHGIFDNIKYNEYRKKYKKTCYNLKTHTILKKSVGVGSQIAQIAGVYYPTQLDNYFKIKKQIHGYGRYMDDVYIIVKTKDQAIECLKQAYQICEELRININKKKTQIKPLSKTFTFLKIRHTLKPSGKIVRKIAKENITRNNRKIKKLAKKVQSNKLPFSSALNSYASFRGRLKKYNNYFTLKNSDNLFNSLFIKDWIIKGEEYVL